MFGQDASPTTSLPLPSTLEPILRTPSPTGATYHTGWTNIITNVFSSWCRILRFFMLGIRCWTTFVYSAQDSFRGDFKTLANLFLFEVSCKHMWLIWSRAVLSMIFQIIPGDYASDGWTQSFGGVTTSSNAIEDACRAQATTTANWEHDEVEAISFDAINATGTTSFTWKLFHVLFHNVFF